MLELGCGIMQHLLDFVPTYPKTRLRCKSLSGVDINQEYLEFLKTKGVTTYHHNLTKIPIPFPDKSYDVVLIIDILEHLPTLEAAVNLITEACRIAKKKVIAFTPTHFRTVNPVGESWEEFGFQPNEYQRHQILIDKALLEKHGFKTRNIKDKSNLHHLYGVRNQNGSKLEQKIYSLIDNVFESRMDAWRRRHGVLFEDGYSSGKVTVGENTFVSHLAVMNPSKDMPIIIGDNCSVKEFCNFHGNLKIGNAVRIATNTVIVTSRHPCDDVSKPLYLHEVSSKGVVIEDDVWIGAGCIILDGATIRKGCILGAGSVVPQDTEIPEYSVAVGNPVRVIKKRGQKNE